jgi:hypothetical protein
MSFKMFPKIPVANGNVTFSSTVFNAGTDMAGHVVIAEEDCTVTTLVVVLAAKTGTPTGTIRFGLQSVGTDGLPTGTWLASGNGYVDYNDWTVAAGAVITLTLGTSVTLAKGDIFAIIYQATGTGTFDGTNTVSLRTNGSNMQTQTLFPYGVANLTGTTAKVAAAGIRLFEYRSSTKVYGFPTDTVTLTATHSGSTPDEWGIEINVPATICSTYKISGTYFSTQIDPTSTFELLLYQDTTVLQTLTVDGDQCADSSRDTFYITFAEDTLSTLNAGTAYIVAIRVTSASPNEVARHRFTIPTAGGREAYSGPMTIRGATRTNQGAWSYSDTTIEMFQPMIEFVASSGGSTAANPLAGYIL